MEKGENSCDHTSKTFLMQLSNRINSFVSTFGRPQTRTAFFCCFQVFNICILNIYLRHEEFVSVVTDTIKHRDTIMPMLAW